MPNDSPEIPADDETITSGTGNVFADLGYPKAHKRPTKLRLTRSG